MFVKPWMQSEVITIHPEDSIAKAGELMKANRIRRLPVVDDENRLLGIISREDIKQAAPSAVDTLPGEQSQDRTSLLTISSFMATEPITCTPGDPLEKVAQTMRLHKIGGIPVTEEGKLVGIITESDIFAAFTEILGGDTEGYRLEIAIDFADESIYEVIDVFRLHDIQIMTLTVCNSFNEKSRLLTIRCNGADIESLRDALWDGGFKINSFLGP